MNCVCVCVHCSGPILCASVRESRERKRELRDISSTSVSCSAHVCVCVYNVVCVAATAKANIVCVMGVDLVSDWETRAEQTCVCVCRVQCRVLCVCVRDQIESRDEHENNVCARASACLQLRVCEAFALASASARACMGVLSQYKNRSDIFYYWTSLIRHLHCHYSFAGYQVTWWWREDDDAFYFILFHLFINVFIYLFIHSFIYLFISCLSPTWLTSWLENGADIFFQLVE